MNSDFQTWQSFGTPNTEIEFSQSRFLYQWDKVYKVSRLFLGDAELRCFDVSGYSDSDLRVTDRQISDSAKRILAGLEKWWQWPTNVVKQKDSGPVRRSRSIPSWKPTLCSPYAGIQWRGGKGQTRELAAREENKKTEIAASKRQIANFTYDIVTEDKTNHLKLTLLYPFSREIVNIRNFCSYYPVELFLLGLQIFVEVLLPVILFENNVLEGLCSPRSLSIR